MLELLEATQKLAASEPAAETEESEDGWTVLWIKSVERTGWKNRVTAEFLGLEDETEIIFSFDSANAVVKPGDVISLRGEEISIFDMEKMRSRSYKATIEQWPLEDGETAEDD